MYNTVTDKTELLTAWHHGITYPGTRRVLFIHEDCRWTTFHPTNRIGYDFMGFDNEQKQSIFDEVMGDIIQSYYNPMIIDFKEGVFI